MGLNPGDIYYIGRYKCFRVKDVIPFRDEFVKAINLKKDIDGMLVEHKNWYNKSNDLFFDPRVYIIVRGNDDAIYAVSFRDNNREDDIQKFDGTHMINFVETKVVRAETLMDDFVLAKPSHVYDYLSPYDPLNIYKVDHTDEKPNDDINSYGVEYACLNGIKLMAMINQLSNQGFNKIVISADEKAIEDLIIFFIKTIFAYNQKSSYVPKVASSYSEFYGNLVLCKNSIAQKYVENGYKLIEFKKMDANESFIQKRLERRDRL